jgi:hypothetical protein
MVTWLNGKKSYLVSAVSLLYGLVYYGWGNNNWKMAMPYIFGGAFGGAIRAAIAKVEAKLL